jgi:hypothetical protein
MKRVLQTEGGEDDTCRNTRARGEMSYFVAPPLITTKVDAVRGMWTWGYYRLTDLVFVLHRNDDLPAVMHSDGTLEWYRHGVPHRENPLLPHRMSCTGTQTWLDAEKRVHREGGLPAIVDADGTKTWMVRGRYFAEGDNPHVVTKDGVSLWFGEDDKVCRRKECNGSVTLFVDGVAVSEVLMSGSGEIRRHVIDAQGVKTLHSDGVLPALVDAEGTQFWYDHGKLRRPDGLPTKVLASGMELWTDDAGVPCRSKTVDGVETWYANGIAVREVRVRDGETRHFAIAEDGSKTLHRDGDLPAYVDKECTEHWYQFGNLRRAGGLPTICRVSGVQVWTDEKGVVGRADGLPAVVDAANQVQTWFVEGKPVKERVECAGGMVKWFKVCDDGTKLLHGDGEDNAAVISADGKVRELFVDGLCTGKVIVDNTGVTTWWKVYHNRPEKIHRGGNKPAVISADGKNKWWYKDGVCNTKVVVDDAGVTTWFKVCPDKQEKIHRSGGQPAVISADGLIKWWYKDGVCTAKMVVAGGVTSWFRVCLDGRTILHRGNKLPAVSHASGKEEWWCDGRLTAVQEVDCADNTLVQRTDVLYDVEGVKMGSTHVWTRDGRVVKKVRVDTSSTVHMLNSKYEEGGCCLVLHRTGDLPAVERADGHCEWWVMGRLTRSSPDKPVIVEKDGSKLWAVSVEGFCEESYVCTWVLHRDDDKPALVDATGAYWWFQMGELKREGDKPTCVRQDATQLWYRGKRDSRTLHRGNDKPAVIYADGKMMWFVSNKPFRQYHQPVVVWPDGSRGRSVMPADSRFSKMCDGAEELTSGGLCIGRVMVEAKSRPRWTPTVLWSAPATRCLECDRVFSKSTNPAVLRNPLVVVCSADTTHAMCTGCLHVFMDEVNSTWEKKRQPVCPLCDAKLKSLIEVPP